MAASQSAHETTRGGAAGSRAFVCCRERIHMLERGATFLALAAARGQRSRTEGREQDDAGDGQLEKREARCGRSQKSSDGTEDVRVGAEAMVELVEDQCQRRVLPGVFQRAGGEHGGVAVPQDIVAKKRGISDRDDAAFVERKTQDHGSRARNGFTGLSAGELWCGCKEDDGVMPEGSFRAQDGAGPEVCLRDHGAGRSSIAGVERQQDRRECAAGPAGPDRQGIREPRSFSRDDHQSRPLSNRREEVADLRGGEVDRGIEHEIGCLRFQLATKSSGAAGGVPAKCLDDLVESARAVGIRGITREAPRAVR